MTRLVVTVTSAESLASSRRAIVRADLVEFRLDLDPTLLTEIGGAPLPVIATVRSQREGGAFAGPAAAARDLLEAALAAGAAYVDLELERDALDLAPAARAIVSWHAPRHTPPASELAARVAALTATRPAYAKLACQTNSGADLLALLDLLPGTAPSAPLAPVAMGAVGVPARILAGRLGWPLAFAATDAARAAAPGQLGIDDLLDRYRFRRLNARTRVYAVLGSPVSGSASPAYHAASLPLAADDGAPLVYVPLELPDLESLPELVTHLGLVGLSVTRPHKTRVASILGATPEAADTGAGGGGVNTLRRDPAGRWWARSTDGEGIARALADVGVTLAGRRVLVLGAGGAARAALALAAHHGADALVASRRDQAAREVAASFGARAIPWRELDGSGAPLATDLVINATPVGSRGQAPAAPRAVGAFAPGAILFDMVYDPRWTPWLTLGALFGHRVVPGLAMFVAQAAAQTRAFLGRDGDVAAGRAAVEARLAPGGAIAWLVGPRGAGKSSIGRALGARLGLECVDLDARIAARAGCSTAELLRQGGHAAFRAVEDAVVADELADRDRPRIIATGGGTVLAHAEAIAGAGVGIFLWASPRTLAARCAADGGATTRPALAGEPPEVEAARVLAERGPRYRRAALLDLCTEDADVATLTERLAGRLAGWEGAP